MAYYVDDFYPNVTEISLFDCHIIHVFKDTITLKCRVNICSDTRDFLFTHKLRGYQIIINQCVCSSENVFGFYNAYVRRGI